MIAHRALVGDVACQREVAWGVVVEVATDIGARSISKA